MAFDSLLAAHRKFLGSDSAEVQQHQNGGKQPAMGIPKIPLLLHYEPARIIGPAGMSRAWRLGNVQIALDFANLDGAAAQSGDIASDGRAVRSRAADDLRNDLGLQREFTPKALEGLRIETIKPGVRPQIHAQ
jgi:hypothetical protein